MPETIPQPSDAPAHPAQPTGPGRGPSARDVARWRKFLADEKQEAASYLALASRRTGEERAILLALAEAEQRHEQHWLALLGDRAGRPRKGQMRTRFLTLFARRFGGVFVLALAQRAESRSAYGADRDATAAMAADERIHEEVVRGLAQRGRDRMSGSFRASVFGANDGLVSNLALILGIGASGASNSTILLSGLAGLLAGALSMGAGEFVSVRSQRELLDASTPSPRASAVVGALDVDRNELALVYRARGMAPAEAEEHAAEVLRNWTDGAQIAPGPAADEHVTHGTAMGAALFSFAMFAAGAIIPVLPYLFGLDGLAAVVVSAVVVGVALLATGAIVGLLSGTSPLTRALRQLAIGWGAAAATYALGAVFGATVS